MKDEGSSNPRKLLSISATSKLLGISVPGVKRLIRSGRLPTVEVGDAVRIPLPAIDRLLNPEEPARPTTGVRGEVGALEVLDELMVHQAQLMNEVQELRKDVASLLAEHKDSRPADSFMTVKEVAELLGISDRSIYRLAEEGGGPPVVRGAAP